jgi:hypothetical protein
MSTSDRIRSWGRRMALLRGGLKNRIKKERNRRKLPMSNRIVVKSYHVQNKCLLISNSLIIGRLHAISNYNVRMNATIRSRSVASRSFRNIWFKIAQRQYSNVRIADTKCNERTSSPSMTAIDAFLISRNCFLTPSRRLNKPSHSNKRPSKRLKQPRKQSKFPSHLSRTHKIKLDLLRTTRSP